MVHPTYLVYENRHIWWRRIILVAYLDLVFSSCFGRGRERATELLPFMSACLLTAKKCVGFWWNDRLRLLLLHFPQGFRPCGWFLSQLHYNCSPLPFGYGIRKFCFSGSDENWNVLKLWDLHLLWLTLERRCPNGVSSIEVVSSKCRSPDYMSAVTCSWT